MRRTWLALAFVAAPLLACPGDDEGETAASSGPVTTGVGTSAPTTTSDESGGASMGSGGSGEATTASGSSGPPADDGSTTAAGATPLDACLATCNHLIECGIEDVPNCGIPCSGVPAMVAGCSAEYVAQQECAAALSCDELQAWVDAMVQPGEHPCQAEDEAYEVCETGATSG